MICSHIFRKLSCLQAIHVDVLSSVDWRDPHEGSNRKGVWSCHHNNKTDFFRLLRRWKKHKKNVTETFRNDQTRKTQALPHLAQKRFSGGFIEPLGRRNILNAFKHREK